MRVNRCFLIGTFRARWSAVVTALTVLAWCGGCGPGAPPTGSVAGTVTYQGQPLTSGVVAFLDEGTGIGASGELDAAGNYRIPSIRTGQYKVAIYREPPPLSETDPAIIEGWKLGIPEKYQAFETTGLTATVGKGGNRADFEL